MKLHPYLTADKIASLNRELGQKISKFYEPIVTPESELLVITTLKGALFFAADLLREITVPLRLDFVRVASYGSGTSSSGTVRILKDIESHPKGQHVLILDEIVDSGRTLNFLIERLRAAEPKTLKVGALLSKPSRREIPVTVDFLGTEVEDKFLIGYGLDHDEKHRNLRDIFYLA